MRNTIRNVTMVVPVLMTSCQVSEYWKTGPEIPHTRIVPSAIAKAPVPPAHLVTISERDSKATPILQRCFWLMSVAMRRGRAIGRRHATLHRAEHRTDRHR